MWKITENKAAKSAQDLRVSAMLKELAQYTPATLAFEFESSFNEHLKNIQKQNNFSANLMFKITQRNLKSVEIWKMTVAGEFKHKMWTVDFIETKTK